MRDITHSILKYKPLIIALTPCPVLNHPEANRLRSSSTNLSTSGISINPATMSADNQSYLEYVKQTASTPQYKWLVNFFRRENVGIKDDTTVTVLDSVKGKVKSTGAYRGITYDPEEIRSAITSSALNTTRIVVLTHGTYEKVNRDLVAIICWTYKLDPLFVMSHFYWDTEADDRRTNPKPKDTEGKKPSYQPISLPSLVNFLSLDDQGQFSCLMLTKLNPPTSKLPSHFNV